MPKGATPATSKAAVGYEYCSKLFALERKFETFAPKTRQQARQAQVEPLLDVYWAWVEKLDPAPGSKLEDAVAYAKNQKAFLNEFMCHGEVDISNNIAENAIRPFVVGRKNWLFCDTPKGAEASAVVYTLVETAKANGLDPFRYLNYVLLNIMNNWNNFCLGMKQHEQRASPSFPDCRRCLRMPAILAGGY